MFAENLAQIRTIATSLVLSIEDPNADLKRVALAVAHFDFVLHEVELASTRHPAANAEEHREALDTIRELRKHAQRSMRLRLDRGGFDGGDLAGVLRSARHVGHGPT